MGLLGNLFDFCGDIFPWLKRREVLRERWARPGDGDGARATWYFDLIRKLGNRSSFVDDKTWSDLEFPRLFKKIDTTITPIGRQYLFAHLRTYEFDPAEQDLKHRAYEVLRSNQRLRENIQLALKPLAVDSAAYMADLFLGPEPEKLVYQNLVVPCSLLAIAAIPVYLAHLVPLWLCVIPFIINMIIAGAMDTKLKMGVDALLDCGRMVDVADRIAGMRGTDALGFLRRLDSGVAARRELKSQVRLLSWLDTLRSAGIVGGLVVIADVLFLLKFSLYRVCIGRFLRTRPHWVPTFQLVGAADASIAVTGFLEQFPQHCRPTVAGDSVIEVENGYHALIREPVKNSITLRGTSALVTGSNMSGKTTFIKMIAMNVIFGHTIGICLADRAILPRSAVRALIRGEQSVEEGKSRYFAEAEAIRDFLEESARGECRIFILDEPFSGTNTVERIAVAKAVLGAIGANAQALVTTHDVELQHLLGANFELFYFQEDPGVETFFDHKLHAGASTQRNAIRVLERLGYPAAIIAEALATVPSIDR